MPSLYNQTSGQFIFRPIRTHHILSSQQISDMLLEFEADVNAIVNEDFKHSVLLSETSVGLLELQKHKAVKDISTREFQNETTEHSHTSDWRLL